MRRHCRGGSARVGAVVLGLATAWGCASGGAGAPTYRTDVSTLPVQPPEAAGESGLPEQRLPDLPVVQRGGGTVQSAPRLQAFSANGQDLQLVLRTLAEGFGLGYRIDPSVQGPVYANLRNATLETALRTILPGEYEYSLQGGVLRVGPARIQTEIFSLDYIALSRVGSGTTAVQRQLGGTAVTGGATGALGGIGGAVPGGLGSLASGGVDVISNVQAFNLWEDIRIALEGLVFESTRREDGAADPRALVRGARAPTAYTRTEPDGRKLIINPIAGTILVAAPPSNMADVRAYLGAFQASVQRQVQIEAKIVEVSLDRRFEFGIDWGLVSRFGDVDLETPTEARSTGGLTLTLRSGGDQITAVLNALDSQGDVRVLSSPRTAAMNNQRALFKVTRQEVFFTVTQQPLLGPDGGVVSIQPQIQQQPIEVGIVLDVMPQVGPDNTISMNIRPLIKSVVEVKEVELGENIRATAPVTEDRTVDTVVRVRNGETIVIGGLMQNRVETRRTGIPVLKDIPLLGRLFGRTEEVEQKQELVIFITPTIVAGSPTVGR